jgi:hypothetical protein
MQLHERIIVFFFCRVIAAATLGIQPRDASLFATNSILHQRVDTFARPISTTPKVAAAFPRHTPEKDTRDWHGAANDKSLDLKVLDAFQRASSKPFRIEEAEPRQQLCGGTC